jgi:hypothetical protein
VRGRGAIVGIGEGRDQQLELVGEPELYTAPKAVELGAPALQPLAVARVRWAPAQPGA